MSNLSASPPMSAADVAAHRAASHVRSQADEALDRAVAASPDRVRSPLPTTPRSRRRMLDLREW